MIDDILENWNDLPQLQAKYLSIVNKQLEIARQIGDISVAVNSAFVSEKDDGYKMTDSYAKAKAKQLVGDRGQEYELEFHALDNLLSLITFRISQLSHLAEE